MSAVGNGAAQRSASTCGKMKGFSRILRKSAHESLQSGPESRRCGWSCSGRVRNIRVWVRPARALCDIVAGTYTVRQDDYRSIVGADIALQHIESASLCLMSEIIWGDYRALEWSTRSPPELVDQWISCCWPRSMHKDCWGDVQRSQHDMVPAPGKVLSCSNYQDLRWSFNFLVSLWDLDIH